jgi:hypothetical protein
MLKKLLDLISPDAPTSPEPTPIPTNGFFFLDPELSRPCLCGRMFKSVPSNAMLYAGIGFKGYFWDCACGATLGASSKSVVEPAPHTEGLTLDRAEALAVEMRKHTGLWAVLPMRELNGQWRVDARKDDDEIVRIRSESAWDLWLFGQANLS